MDNLKRPRADFLFVSMTQAGHISNLLLSGEAKEEYHAPCLYFYCQSSPRKMALSKTYANRVV